MRKPEFRWQTRRHRARLVPSASGASAHDERFELCFFDGRTGHAWLRLDRQRVDRRGESDPDLLHAIRCWLAARGCWSLQLEDFDGRTVQQGVFRVDELGDPGPTTPARRVVSLAPSNAEVIDALGAFDRVVACEDSTDYPRQADQCLRLGPDLGPDLDRVAALDPDLVVSSLSVPGMERIVTGLRARGVRQVVLAPARVDEVQEDLRRVGERLGRLEQAEHVIASMQAQKKALRDGQPASPLRIYLEWWPRPMFSPGRDSFADELITLAGGINVFGDRAGASVQIEAHELIEADPQLCFVSWCGVTKAKLDPRQLIEREGLERLSAGVRGRVYPLDECYTGRPGPRMLEASRQMAAAIRHYRVQTG